jgi:hypothetical protein
MSDYFQTAYARARAHFTDDQWLALEPRQITRLIYEEMHRIDAEIVAAAQPEDAEARQAS